MDYQNQQQKEQQEKSDDDFIFKELQEQLNNQDKQFQSFQDNQSEKIKHLQGMTDQISQNLSRMNRNFDDMSRKYCPISQFNQQAKTIENLQKEIDKYKIWKEGLEDSLEGFRTQSFDLKQYDFKISMLERYQKSSETVQLKLMDKQTKYINKYDKMLDMHDEAISAAAKQLLYFAKLDQKDQELEKNKADKTQLTQMEARADGKYFTKNEFLEFRQEYDEYNAKNVKEFESKNEKVFELISKLDSFKSTLARIQKELTLFQEDQTNNNDTFINRFVKQDASFKKVDEKFNEFKTDMKILESKLATKEQFAQLKERMEKFTSLENLKTIEQVFLPKLNRFINSIETFEKDNESVKECVRRFDEILSLKANKGELSTHLSRLESQFISYHLWEGVQQKFDEMQVDFFSQKQKYEQELVEYRMRESIHIKESIKQAIQANFNQFQEVYTEFRKYFNQEYLSEVFNKKADKEQLLKISNQKADRQEIKEAKETFQSLNLKIYTLASLQGQCAQYLQAQNNNEFKKQMQAINSQALIICKKFDDKNLPKKRIQSANQNHRKIVKIKPPQEPTEHITTDNIDELNLDLSPISNSKYKTPNNRFSFNFQSPISIKEDMRQSCSRSTLNQSRQMMRHSIDVKLRSSLRVNKKQ